MACGIAAMRQQSVVRALGIEEGVVKDRHALEGTFRVDAFRDAGDGAVVPLGSTFPDDRLTRTLR
jgi:hypothetical protein